MKKLFTEHPNSVGETYGEHMASALSFAYAMAKGGVCCLIHAMLPFLFERTASDIVGELHPRMIAKRTEETAKRRTAKSAKTLTRV